MRGFPRHPSPSNEGEGRNARPVPARSKLDSGFIMSILLLVTGGTFDKEYHELSGELDFRDTHVPKMLELGRCRLDVVVRTAMLIDSLDMTEGDRQFLLAHIRREDERQIVITHGTDTMEESAFFLNLTVKSDKPVVLVGSMRPSTAVSADGPLNLYNAVGVAADPNARGRGVMVVMNDWIHGAHSLTKTSTTAVQTFLSPARGLVGIASYGKNDFYGVPPWKHTSQSEFDISNVTKLPRVDILYAYLDMSPALIDASAGDGKNAARGIVIAGVGNGNMTAAAVEAAARAVKKGVVVVRASRVATGTVGRNVEIDDDGLGFIASDELNPQKSRILLALALLEPRPAAELQKLFTLY